MVDQNEYFLIPHLPSDRYALEVQSAQLIHNTIIPPSDRPALDVSNSPVAVSEYNSPVIFADCEYIKWEYGMPNVWDDEDEDFSSDSDLVKQLRKQLRDTRRSHDALETEVKTLRPQVHKNAISQTLSKLGYPSKLAAFVPADMDPSEATVKGWLDEYGDVFNIAPKLEPQEVTPIVGKESDKATIDSDQIPVSMQEVWSRVQGGDSAIGASVPDAEKAQLSALGDAVTKSGGNFDKYISLLRNEPILPM